MKTNFLRKLHLSFTEENNEKNFQMYIGTHSLMFFKCLVGLAFLTSSILSIFNMLTGNYTRTIISVSLLITFCFLYFILIKKVLTCKWLIDIFLTLFVFSIYTVHLEIIVPNMMANTPIEYKKLSYEWMLFNIGKNLDSILIILYVSRIKWIYLALVNLIMNYLSIKKFIESSSIEYSTEIVIFHSSFVTILLPIFVSYFNERKERSEFLKLKKAEESLTGFEKLITDIIPNEIILLKSEPPSSSVFYANKSAKILFRNEDLEALYRELLKFKFCSLEEGKNQNLNFNEIFEIADKTEENNMMNFKTYEGTYSTSKKKKVEEQKEHKFVVKIGAMLWKNEKVIFLLLNETTTFLKFKKIKEINEYKDMLLATVSHDLRSPLNSILGMLELAIEQCTDKSLKKLIRTAQKSSKILSFLINDILDFSQINKNQLKLIPQPFYLETIISEIIEIVKFQAKKKSLQFKIEISEQIKQMQMYADPLRLQQILLNLLGNAIKFTLKGEIKLKVIFENFYAKLFVSDTGIGISTKNISKLFSRFLKIDEVNESINKGGIGLGLFISQTLAKSMHPNGISVKSELNKGTEFQFCLPILNPEILPEEHYHLLSISKKEQTIADISPTNKITPSKASSLISRKFTEELANLEEFSPSQSHKRKLSLLKNSINHDKRGNLLIKINHLDNQKILIVDDEIMNIIILSKYLEIFGMQSEAAHNGKEAIEKIKEKAKKNEYYAIILMDCNMPIMNGLQATKKIKNMIKKNKIKNLKIIGITANVSTKEVQDCFKFGMDDYLEKPVSRKTIQNKLKELLNMPANEL